jgi:hypothetical protein
MSSELQSKRNAHREAQETRRALEQEQREIPGKLEYALSGGDVEAIHELNRRKREIREDIQNASAVEHASYSALVRAEQAAELSLYETAQEQLDQAEAKLFARREEWRKEEAALAAEVDKWTVKRNHHEREYEAWSTRFSTADGRYRQAVAEQEEPRGVAA